MDLVNRSRIVVLIFITLWCTAVLGEKEPEEIDSASEEASIVEEKQPETEERSPDDEKDEPQVNEDQSMTDKEDTDTETSETYTRLPVKTRINPNQNVALPQDI